MDEGLHVLLRLELRKTDAHRHMDLLTRCRGEMLLLELRSGSLRGNSAVTARRHGQEYGELFTAVTISGIRMAHASFDHLAESHQDLVSLDMAVSVVEPFEIVEIEKQKGYRLSVAVRPIDLHLELMIKMPGIVELGEIIDNTELPVFFSLSSNSFSIRLRSVMSRATT